MEGREEKYLDYDCKGRSLGAVKERKKRLVYFCCAGLLVSAFYMMQIKTVELIDGENEREYYTFSKTVEEFIKEKELQVKPHDLIFPSRESHLEHSDTIYVKRSVPVKIKLDGEKKEVFTHARTVKELLREQSIKLGEEDMVAQSLDAQITAGKTVEVINYYSNYDEEYIVEQEEIPFSTISIANPSLGNGATKTVKEGKAGLQENKIKVVTRGEEEILREHVSSEVVAEPVNRVVEYGGNEPVSRSGRNMDYDRVLDVEATAYCPGTPSSGCPIDSSGASKCTGNNNDGFTYTGIKAEAGEGTLEQPHIVAVDPSVIPLDTILYIEGIGFAVAEDTGSAVKGNIIDILFDNHDEAKAFGRQKLRVYILE